MTTVLNGSTVTYNRDGVTVDSYTANGTNVGPSTTTIARSARHTVAVVTVPNGSNYACNLPSGAEVGDVVEVYFTTSGWVFAPSGETFVLNGASAMGCDIGAAFRKVSSSVWGYISK